LIRLYQNSENHFAENRTRSINRDDEKFSSLENFLLKQDVHFTQFDGTIYITFGYSSLLMAVGEEGLRYATLGPENYPFPEPEDPGSGRFVLPAIDEYPVGALDIDADEEYVYILYSGQKIEVDRISEFSGPDAYIEEIRNSRRVMKFHREDGSFAGEKELPRSASVLKVKGDRIFLYTTKGEDFPTLYVYDRKQMTPVSAE
jgi:hypothetical protein